MTRIKIVFQIQSVASVQSVAFLLLSLTNRLLAPQEMMVMLRKPV